MLLVPTGGSLMISNIVKKYDKRAFNGISKSFGADVNLDVPRKHPWKFKLEVFMFLTAIQARVSEDLLSRMVSQNYPTSSLFAEER